MSLARGAENMALTLVKEDGSGKADANSYADVADGDAYFEGHLYGSAWTAATAGQEGGGAGDGDTAD